MLNVKLIGINAKFPHTSLSIRCLKSYCAGLENVDVKTFECSINDSISSILRQIYRVDADVYAFSCYIWNISIVLKLAHDIKMIDKNATIILGGPEVSFDCDEILASNESIDHIVRGEGEQQFFALLQSMSNGESIPRGVFSGVVEDFKTFDDFHFAYFDVHTTDFNNRIVYYESSRGCPYNCSYCLSSTISGVCNRSLENVERDLEELVLAGAKIIKFVDRTFNADSKRALCILKICNKYAKRCKFHFEISADLIDGEMIDFLATVKKGLMQFEIGVQSTNTDTLAAIDRHTNLDKLQKNVTKLLESRTVELHIDLIAGLPYETFESFVKSFNWVYALSPHVVQVGFLKMLRGSKVRHEADLFEYAYSSYPPYEILSSSTMAYTDLVQIKYAENAVERVYNSGAFEKSVEFVIERHYSSSPFEFFKNFGKHLGEAQCSRKNLYQKLTSFYIENFGQSKEFSNFLKYDYIMTEKSLPPWVESIFFADNKSRIFSFLSNPKYVENHLPKHAVSAPKQMLKNILIEQFGGRESRIILFDFLENATIDITKDFYDTALGNAVHKENERS